MHLPAVTKSRLSFGFWKRLNSPVAKPRVVECPWLSAAPTIAPAYTVISSGKGVRISDKTGRSNEKGQRKFALWSTSLKFNSVRKCTTDTALSRYAILLCNTPLAHQVYSGEQESLYTLLVYSSWLSNIILCDLDGSTSLLAYWFIKRIAQSAQSSHERK